MKPHFIIKLKNALLPRPPSWEDVLKNSQLTSPVTITDNIDHVLKNIGLSVIVTSEYNFKNGKSWSDDELGAGFDRIYRIILKDSFEIPAQVIENLANLPEVEYARPGHIGYTKLPEHYTALSQTSRLEKGHELIHLKEAQIFSKGNAAIKIAVLDTGIDMQHPEIEHAIIQGKDFVNIIDGAKEFIGDFLDFDDSPDDEVGHGSHVAGILVSRGKRMPAGIVPDCKIMPVRVLGAMKNGEEIVGAGLIDNINTGIKWAVDNGANIINMSLGIKREGGGLPHEEVIHYALQKGVTVVAASGNDGTNDKYYPGALKGVIAVGAVNEKDEIAEFSTFGAHVSFVAPGTNIYSSYKLHDYAFSSGTSQASPFVTGSIALLKSYAYANGKELNDKQIKYILKNTADKPDGHLRNDKWGYGRINLIDAIKLLNYKLNILN